MRCLWLMFLFPPLSQSLLDVLVALLILTDLSSVQHFNQLIKAEFRPFTVAGKLPVLISELFGSGWTVLQVSCVFIHTMHGQWDSLIDKAGKRVDLVFLNNCVFMWFFIIF